MKNLEKISFPCCRFIFNEFKVTNAESLQLKNLINTAEAFQKINEIDLADVTKWGNGVTTNGEGYISKTGSDKLHKKIDKLQLKNKPIPQEIQNVLDGIESLQKALNDAGFIGGALEAYFEESIKVNNKNSFKTVLKNTKRTTNFSSTRKVLDNLLEEVASELNIDKTHPDAIQHAIEKGLALFQTEKNSQKFGHISRLGTTFLQLYTGATLDGAYGKETESKCRQAAEAAVIEQREALRKHTHEDLDYFLRTSVEPVKHHQQDIHNNTEQISQSEILKDDLSRMFNMHGLDHVA